MSSSAAGKGGGGKKAAGAFDVRNVIAGLIGAYGVVLVIMGLVHNSDAELKKTGGVNANLWAGLVMVAIGLAFLIWARLRPVVVDPKEIERAKEDVAES